MGRPTEPGSRPQHGAYSRASARAGGRGRRAPVVAAALTAVAGLVLGGCSGTAGGAGSGGSGGAAEGGASSGSATAGGLTASVSQFREDEVRREVRVRLVATAPATVTSLALDWAGLPGLPATTPDYPLQPRVAADLPLPLGPAACGSPARADTPLPSTAPADVTAVVGLRGADGGTTSVRVPVGDATDTLGRIFASACRQQALADLVTVTFGNGWRAGTAHGLPAQLGTLEVARAAATGALTVTELGQSVVMDITPEPADGLPATLPAGQAGLTLPVAITTSRRCSGHDLGETKQPYLFEVFVDVGSAAGLQGVQPVLISAPDGIRDRLWQTMLAGCTQLGHHEA